MVFSAVYYALQTFLFLKIRGLKNLLWNNPLLVDKGQIITQTNIKYGSAESPNSSIPRKTALTRLFVTQLNKPTNPSAAAKPTSNPKAPPRTQPKVAPMQNVGTISPPLKPAARVMAVNAIFKAKSNHILLYSQGLC